MVPTTDPALFRHSLACLEEHGRVVGRGFRGRFIQIFLGLKFFQNSVPSMYSGSFMTSGVLQGLLDDLFAKCSRPATSTVLSLFENNYLARTGVSGQNTWRNNLNLQKGIGCYASPAELSSPTFLDEPRASCRHLTPAVVGALKDARCALCPSGAKYRGESHRKWLRIAPDGDGYAVTDLLNTANFSPYVAPKGLRIPILPLLTAIYHDADPGLVTGGRSSVTVAEFASDFNFAPRELDVYFDTSPTHPLNAWWRSHAATAASAPTSQAAPAANVPASPFSAPVAAQIVAAPVLGGTPTPPPITNNGWGAEQYVAQALRSVGWDAYVVSRQQLGYDIFAERGREKRYVEVKSSLGLCSPSLTAREWQRAKFFGDDYVLAVLENFDPFGSNVVYWIKEPASTCVASAQVTVSHSISRTSWTSATVSIAAI